MKTINKIANWSRKYLHKELHTEKKNDNNNIYCTHSVNWFEAYTIRILKDKKHICVYFSNSCAQSWIFAWKFANENTYNTEYIFVDIFFYINPCVNKWVINLDRQVWATERDSNNGCEWLCVVNLWLVAKVYKRHSLLSTDESRHQSQSEQLKRHLLCACRESGRKNKTIHIDKWSVLGVCLLLLDYERTNDWVSAWAEHVFVYVYKASSYN